MIDRTEDAPASTPAGASEIVAPTWAFPDQRPGFVATTKNSGVSVVGA
jgi:hypothetical protein